MNTAVGNILRNLLVLVEIASLSEISKSWLVFEKRKPHQESNRSTERLLLFVYLFACPWLTYLAPQENLEG